MEGTGLEKKQRCWLVSFLLTKKAHLERDDFVFWKLKTFSILSPWVQISRYSLEEQRLSAVGKWDFLLPGGEGAGWRLSINLLRGFLGRAREAASPWLRAGTRGLHLPRMSWGLGNERTERCLWGKALGMFLHAKCSVVVRLGDGFCVICHRSLGYQRRRAPPSWGRRPSILVKCPAN